jgi:choice-of-anchor A domain-containing protein
MRTNHANVLSRRSLAAAAAGMMLCSMVATQTLGSGAASAQANLLGAAGAYNEYSFGNSSRGAAYATDATGSVAVGGNLSGQFYLNGPTSGYALVVGGNVDLQSYAMGTGRSGIYGGSNLGSAQDPGLVQGTASNPLPINFVSADQVLTADSANWGGLAQTSGASASLSYGTLTLSGTNTSLDVFDVPAATFAQAQTVSLHVPSGATALVNVSGSPSGPLALDEVQMSAGSAQGNLTLFNFPTATSLTLANAGLAGTFLAPDATFTFNNGQLNGNVYAYSVNGTFQDDGTSPFAGTISTSPPSCQASTFLGGAYPYSEYSFSNSTRGQAGSVDTEGPVAVGGNLVADLYYVGIYSAYSTSLDALVVAGNVSGTLTIQGPKPGVYGGTSTAVEASTGKGPTGNLSRSTSLPVNFQATDQLLAKTSAQLAALAGTPGSTITKGYGATLLLSGTGSAINVFDVPAGVLAGAHVIEVNVPVGSTTVINVPDSQDGSATGPLPLANIEYWDGSAYEGGAQYDSAAVDTVRDATIVNFPDATSVGFAAAGIAATILAPNAIFTFNNGQLDGNVYAYSVNGSFQEDYTSAYTGAYACS